MDCAPSKISVSVIVTTRNEEARIQACLESLKDFSEIIVVDSGSTDRTLDIAARLGAKVIDFHWNGQYPKKRQWCLDTLDLAHEWIFFVDADEILTPEFVRELRALDFKAAGYFVKGAYIFEGRALRFGLQNNKLVLFDRRKIEFPVVDDLQAPGMGEMEGHYQPVLKKNFSHEIIGQVKAPVVHDACDDQDRWLARHTRYAAWERSMNARGAWPGEATAKRMIIKKIFRALPLRPVLAFLHCYVWKLGFLDGLRGFRFALSRYRYYRMI